MIRRIAKLLGHPGFRANPVAVIWRGIVWSFCVLAKRSPAFPLSPGGGLMRVPPDLRYTSVTAYLMRDWAEPELHFLDRVVKRGGIFIDAGANVGLYTLRAAPLVGPTGSVVSIEPGKVAADQLEANLALNPGFTQVKVVRKAASDKPGTAVLHHIQLGDDPQAFSLLSDGRATEGETVEVTTVDQLVEQFGLPRVDCIKMDVEGAEPMLIEGARQTIERHHPIILFEINTIVLSGSAVEPTAAYNALAAFGYKFFSFGPGGRLEQIVKLPEGWGNLVAVHPAGPQPV